jgi:RND family efflux transporter MFP subunit
MRTLILLPLLTLTACAPSELPGGAAAAAAQTDRSQAPSVQTAAPEAVRFRPTEELTGSLEPVASVQLGFDVPGRIQSLLVTRGAHVTAGQAVARLDSRMAEAQAAQAGAALTGAQAQLANGEASFLRAQKLKEAGALSEQQYADAVAGIEAARAGVDQAKAAVRLTKTNLDNHTLRAPIGGVITNAPDNAGVLVGAGSPMFVIEDLSALQLKGSAPESAAWIREGLDATVLPGTPGATVGFPARVVRVIPSLDPISRRLPVEVRIDNPDASLRAHAYARVSVTSGDEVDAFEVPKAALSARPDFCVFVLPGPTAAPIRVPVTVLAERGDKAVVKGDLATDRPVILNPAHGLGEE